MRTRASAVALALLAFALPQAPQARAAGGARSELTGSAVATPRAGSELTASTARARSKPARKSTAKAPPRPNAVPFITDDYDRALAAARAAHLPLFIESWAPW